MERIELDLRIGGRYRFVFDTPDGEHHEVGGFYREVVTDERLVYTWAWYTMPERESVVTVSFRADGNGTILTLDHAQFFDEAARTGHTRGWTASLDRFKRYFG